MKSSDRLLICTDLDGTLIPDGREPESPGAYQYFTILVSRPHVELAYVSGRHGALIGQAITEHRLPVPDYVIGDVGTTIYRINGAYDWTRQNSWAMRIGRDWNNNSHADLAAMLEDVPGLQLQEAEQQNTLKLSYYVPSQRDKTSLRNTILQRLTANGVQARLIWSMNRVSGKGLLDIVPRGASKLHATRELMARQGYGLHNTVFCGDSGNDLEILASPVAAVVVANAQREIKDQARKLSSSSGNSTRLYIASGGFMGMNGNYCGGMLEGIVHFFPHTAEWMGLAHTGRARLAL